MPRADTVVVFDGQSLNNYPLTGLTFPYLIMNGRGLPWENVSFSGESWTALTGIDAGLRCDLIAKQYDHAVLVMTGGSSDLLLESDTPAQALADMAAYANARRAGGFDKIIGTTIPPGSLLFNSGNEADRLATNALIVANGLDFLDYIVDICVEPLLDYNDTDYWEADKNHWNAGGALVGYQLYMPAVDAALASLGVA